MKEEHSEEESKCRRPVAALSLACLRNRKSPVWLEQVSHGDGGKGEGKERSRGQARKTLQATESGDDSRGKTKPLEGFHRRSEVTGYHLPPERIRTETGQACSVLEKGNLYGKRGIRRTQKGEWRQRKKSRGWRQGVWLERRRDGGPLTGRGRSRLGAWQPLGGPGRRREPCVGHA